MAGGIQTRTLHLNLLENGVDFVKEALETYFLHDTGDARAIKYTILNMWSGTLLLLKERLRRIKPELVFTNPSKASLVGAKTVSFDALIVRLTANGVSIASDAMATLRSIQNVRNSLEHYDLQVDLAQARAITGSLLCFLHTFCWTELGFFIEERMSRSARKRFFELDEVTGKIVRETFPEVVVTLTDPFRA